jgi:hypothetical protein
MRTLEDLIAEMTPQERASFDRAREQSRKRDMQLQILRSLYRKARADVAAQHGITDIPAFEETADEFIKAMRECLTEMGGRLTMTLEFKDLEPVPIEGIADLGTDDDPA